MPVVLSVLDAAYTRIDEGADILAPVLAYERVTFHPNRIDNKKVKEPASLIRDHKQIGKLFLTGFLPRVEQFCRVYGIPLLVKYDGPNQRLPFSIKTDDELDNLEDKERRYQEEIANIVVAHSHYQRGVIHAVTGTGKTRMMVSILNRFPDNKGTIIIVPNTTLLNQVYDVMKFHFPTKIIHKHGGGYQTIVNPYHHPDMIISTRQSVNTLTTYIPQIILVDETHLGSDFDGELAKYLRTTGKETWVRYGFTATLPDSEEAKLSMEGLIGPVLAVMDMERAMELDIVAHPRVKLVVSPTLDAANEQTKYDDVYRLAIIYNRARNVCIINEAEEQVSQGKKVLILITALAQGEELIRIAAISGMDAVYLNGQTDDELIEQARRELDSGKRTCVIASNIWSYGVDIPELDVVIIAGAGRSTAASIQKAGRILRRTESKSEGLIIDFLDSYRYISGQVVEHLRTYVGLGWL